MVTALALWSLLWPRPSSAQGLSCRQMATPEAAAACDTLLKAGCNTTFEQLCKEVIEALQFYV